MRHVLDVTLELLGPVLTQATVAGGFGLDAPMARTADNKLSLPGTLIKGRLRQAFEELNGLFPDDKKPFPADIWFGSESGRQLNGDEKVDPIRGTFCFSDFIADEPTSNGRGTIHRVKMNDSTGTVDKGAYLVIEAPVPPGRRIEFVGTISFVNSNPEPVVTAIEKGLQWITSLGGERTVGFGRLIGVTVTSREATVAPVAWKGIAEGTTALRLALVPEGPFCLARKKVDGNIFTSEEVIPGGVIKGGIATTWGLMIGKGANVLVDDTFDADRKELCLHFSAIRFTHAFPSAEGSERPVMPPLSLVKANKTPYDVAAIKGAVLVGNQAPAFDIDWKDFDDIRNKFGWPQVERRLLVRTAMDRETRSAEKNKLFAYESVVPGNNRWLASIDLSGVPADDRSAVARQLSEILANGLVGWSKTKTSALAAIETFKGQDEGNFFRHDGDCILSLQTPAILCEPMQLNEKSDHSRLFAAYTKTWDKLSNGSLQLVRFFARQELLGGYYLHQRFQKGRPYYPWLLTTAGSVFVLKPIEGKMDEAEQYIKTSLANGLPLLEWAVREYANGDKPGDHWQNCPYIRQNGFGEIAVNLKCHETMKPTEYTEVSNVL
jgi:RAMP superfamily